MKRILFLTILLGFVLAVEASDTKPHKEPPIKRIVLAPGRYIKELLHEIGVGLNWMTVKR